MKIEKRKSGFLGLKKEKYYVFTVKEFINFVNTVKPYSKHIRNDFVFEDEIRPEFSLHSGQFTTYNKWSINSDANSIYLTYNINCYTISGLSHKVKLKSTSLIDTLIHIYESQ